MSIESIAIIVLIIISFVIYYAFFFDKGYKYLINSIRDKTLTFEEFNNIITGNSKILKSPHFSKVIQQCVISERIDLLSCIDEIVPIKTFDNDNEISLLTFSVACVNCLDIANFLIDRGIEVNRIKGIGINGITTAIRMKKTELIKKFLCYDVDVNIRDSEGSSYLLVAAIGTDDDICKTMKYTGEDVYENLKNKEKEVIKILLNSGAEINVKNNEGFTPVHFGALAYTSASLEELLENGADPNIKVNSLTPIDLVLSRSMETPQQETNSKLLLLLKHNNNKFKESEENKNLLEKILSMANKNLMSYSNLFFKMLKMEEDEKVEDIFYNVLKEKVLKEIPNEQISELFDLILPRIAMQNKDSESDIIDDLISRNLKKSQAKHLFDRVFSVYSIQFSLQLCRLQLFLFPDCEKLYLNLDNNDLKYQLIRKKIILDTEKKTIINLLNEHDIIKANIQELSSATISQRATFLPDLGPVTNILNPYEIMKRHAFIKFIFDAESIGISRDEVLIRIWLRFNVNLNLIEEVMNNFINTNDH